MKHISIFLLAAGIGMIGRAQSTGLSDEMFIAELTPKTVMNGSLEPAGQNIQSVRQATELMIGIESGSNLKTKIYPDPVNDQLRFYISGLSGQFNFQVVSADGRILESGFGNPNKIISIDFSVYPAGEYSILIKSANGEIENTFLFIKFEALALR